MSPDDVTRRCRLTQVRRDEERLNESARTAVVQSGYEMSHTAGFEAWIRNQQGLQTFGVMTAEDLVRQSKSMGIEAIEATDSTATPLPPLTATAVRYEAHGPPERVLEVDRAHALPDQLAHGEVLVYMLAACVNEEDLLRVQTPLTVLNNFPPFSRMKSKWEEIALPAVAGLEGVGIVIATAKDVPPPAMDNEAARATRQLPGMQVREDALEIICESRRDHM